VGRLPGVSVISDSGEGNRVVIRGMDPRFNLVTINGVRAPSDDEGANAVGLAGISPFMIAGIEIQKSLTPDKDGDAVGGIVDLKLRDAEAGFKTNVVFQNNINNIIPSSNFNPRATLQLSNRFLDNRLGAIFVGNYENIDRSSQRMNVSTIYIEDLQASENL
jgi:outer membrane receptor for ferrienterochelin and colicin